VKDITVPLENMHPLTADNTALEDFDLTIVYGLNENKVADIYTTKSRTLHTNWEGDTYLLHSYMETLGKNAAYKEVRKYASLEVTDKRELIEQAIAATIRQQLANEGFGDAAHVTNVVVRNVQPNAQIVLSATQYVRAQNELKVKTTEVEIAKKESERMAALSNNSANSIMFMQAQSQLNISEGIKNGKVHTVVVPADFRGMVNVGK
jgi:hypothetical protein